MDLYAYILLLHGTSLYTYIYTSGEDTAAALAAELDLEGATVEGYSEEIDEICRGRVGAGVRGGRGDGPQGGESWKERIKKSQLAQAVAADRRMQRLAQAQEKMQGGEGADGGGGGSGGGGVGALGREYSPGRDSFKGESKKPSKASVANAARPKMCFSFNKK